MAQVVKSNPDRDAVVMFLATHKIKVIEPRKVRNDPKLGKVTLGYPEKALTDAHIKRRK